MANLNINNFKASGIYTQEIDRTIDIPENVAQNRLVVGFSRKGLFNTPVVISSITQRKEVFGEIDTFLERRGSFFHRSIDVALEQGPVIALNLLPLDDTEEGDKVEYMSISTSQNIKNALKQKTLYSSFYDKEKFWKPSVSNFKSLVDTYTPSKIISFTNLSQDKYSIIIKKAEKRPNDRFDILIQDFYGKNSVPSYLDPLDYLSDYFVEVYIIKGDFSNFNSLSTDPVYSKYFNASGLKKEQLVATRNTSDFETASVFYGTLIPNFFDGNGISYSIDNVINRFVSKTGIFCFLDSDYIESLENYNSDVLDLVGHSLVRNENLEDLEYLSYKIKMLENLIYTRKQTFTKNPYVAYGGTLGIKTSLGNGQSGIFENLVLVQGTSVQSNITANVSLIELEGGKFAKIKSYSTSSGNTLISYTHPMKTSEGKFRYAVQSANTSSNSIVLTGQHGDFSYCINKPVLIQNDFNKFYYTLSSYTSHSGNNRTTLTFTTNENLYLVDETYKASWASGYEILKANSTANTITISGKHDIANVYSSLSSNLLYLKTNSEKLGNITISSFSYDSDNNTVLGLSSGNIRVANGTTYNIVSSNLYSEITDGSYFVTYGYYGVMRPNITAGNVNIVHDPDVINTEGNTIIAYKDSILHKNVDSGNLTVGDFYYKEIAPSVVYKYFLSFEKTLDVDGIDILKLKIYNDSSLTATGNTSITFGNKKNNKGTYTDLASNELGFSSKVGNINEYIDIVETYDNGTRIRLSSTEGSKISVGDYVSSFKVTEGETRYFLSKVYLKKKVIIGTLVYYDIYIPRSAKIINDSTFKIEKYKDIQNFIDSYNLFSLGGFTMKSYHIPGDSLNNQSQLVKILSVLKDTSLMDALSDRNLIDFRYIIDTFSTNISPQMYPKNILTELAKKQGKSIAFINMPKVETFIKSNPPGPVFTDYDSTLTVKKVYKPEYVASGGNTSLSPEFFFNLPSVEQGSKYGAIFGPYFRYRTQEGSIIDFPPCAVISNLFVRKLNNGEEFSITAGTTRGSVTTNNIAGLEYTYTDEDRGYLEPAGYNTCINKRGYGIILYSNQTMYQKELSALNNLHVRDALVTIERGIEDILERYVFETNTPTTRLNVANDVRTYLKSVLVAGGISDYSVTIDETNNTNETIQANFGIIDVSIEPVLGLQKFINTLVVERTQGIKSSGFRI